jgi:hypothetical protein
MELNFVSRKDVIDYYLELLNDGELTEEQYFILNEFSQSI